MSKYTWDKDNKIYRTPSGNRMTTDMVLKILNGKWGRSLRKVDIKERGIILIKRPKEQDDTDFALALRALSDDVLQHLGVSTVLIGVENLSDLQFMDEEQMAYYGLMWKDKCYISMDEADKFLAEYKGEEEE